MSISRKSSDFLRLAARDLASFPRELAQSPRGLVEISRALAQSPRELDEIRAALALSPRELDEISRALALSPRELDEISRALAMSPRELAEMRPLSRASLRSRHSRREWHTLTRDEGSVCVVARRSRWNAARTARARGG